MHGRLKVRTTAEMEAINRKKEQEKAKFYETKFSQIIEKRNNQQLDDEMLSLIAEILRMNPDLLTLWNIRKETLLKMKGEVEDNAAVTDAELKLTESGLRINPKSYGAWHHRCWVLDCYSTNPNWEKELQICTKYLELDERNFHCWDYRRYVVERHSTPFEKELDYSMQKLMSNFSNYSAWHYRSKLLPRVYRAFERNKLFENDIYKQEVSLVENAVYTDPNDQSAWFYHRWLLGHISNPVRIIQAGQTAFFYWISVFPRNVHINIEGLGEGDWEYLDGDKFSNVLVKKRITPTSDVKITLYEGDNPVDSIELTETTIAREVNFKPVLSDIEKLYLQQQLASYRQLAKLEPNNKWALLASNLIKEKLNEAPSIEVLENLKSIDTLRSNYYSDTISRQLIEEKLNKIVDWNGNFSACNNSLTAFHHSYFFTCFVEVDLSNNPLGDGVITKLKTFFSCKILKLSNCQLTNIDSFPALENLTTLDISQNKIECISPPTGLMQCVSLKVLNCANTLVSERVINHFQVHFEFENSTKFE